MKTKYILLVIFLIGLEIICNAKIIAKDNNPFSKNNFFIENKGQWNHTVRYLLQTNNYNAWITDFGIVYDYFEFFNDTVDNTVGKKGDVIIMKFESSFSEKSIFETKDELITKYNYFIGDDESKWAANVALFKEVTVKNIYDGIDVRYYVDENNGNNLRYDFELQPFANPNDIKYSFVGAEKIAVNQNGELEIHTKNKTFKHTNLLAYQLDENNNQKIIFSEFVVSEISNMQIGRMQYAPTSIQLCDRRGVLHTPIDTNTPNDAKQSFVAFNLGAYDKSKKLVIDPLIYSVLLGSVEAEFGYGIATDSAGCAYVVGEVFSPKFPTTSGSYSTNHNNGYNVVINSDAFVSKIDKTGKQIIFSTFLGGTKRDIARYIRVDDDFNIYVVGETNSVDTILPHRAFPRLSSNSTLATLKDGWNTFVTKLSPMGNQLKFSMLLGGDYNDNSGGLELIKNNAGVATDVVVAVAYSKNVTGSISDCYIAVIDSAGSQIKYEKFIGGNSSDIPKSLTVDTEKNIYVAGNTSSANFPVSTNAFQKNLKGANDIFVTKLDSTLSEIIFSTFFGGTKNDIVSCISIDSDNKVYITGHTFSADFPMTPNAYKSGTLKADSANIFVTKFNQNGSGLEYSATITSEKQNFSTGIVVDKNKNAHITGYTTSTDFPTTWDAFFTEYSQFGDAIYSVFDSTGSELIFSSFIGGSQYEYAHGLALDKISSAYICGATTSQRNFPYSQIFSDLVIRLDTVVTVSDSIWVIDTIFYNPITNKYDTIGWYEPTKYDTSFVNRNVPNLGSYDIFVFKASYKPYPGELVTNINAFGTMFCLGDVLDITLETPHGFYYPDNIFRIQISDADGNFSPNSTVIGSLRADKGGIIRIIFPASLVPSNKYRIRAISTNPRSIGEDNGIDLDISPPRIVLDSNNIPKSFCSGEQIQVSFSTNPCFNTNNNFILQLSDTAGSFANPIILATVANNQNTFTVNISDTIKLSKNYKIRVVSTSPQIISNALNIAIVVPAISFDSIDFSSILSLCADDIFDFEFNATNCFFANNIFYLILSDSSGNFSNSAFSNSDTVGNITSGGSFYNLIIEGKISKNILFSENYKMKIVSTNPKIEAILGLNFVIGKPYISTENLDGISLCKDLETTLLLNTNNCFDDENVFEFLIKIGNDFVKIGETKPNEKNIPLKIPNNFLYDTATAIVKSTLPETQTNEFKIKIALPEVEIISHQPIELCKNDNFTIHYLTNGCFKDTVNITVELSKNDTSFSNPTVIGIGKIFNNSGTVSNTVNAKLPDEIDEYAKYFIRFVSATNDFQPKIFQLNINPTSIAISTDISSLQVLCSGVSIHIDFEAKGCFALGNIFILQFGKNGDFSNPLNVDTCRNDERKFRFYLPDNLGADFYKIRIISENPYTVSDTSDVELRYNQPEASLTASGDIIVCHDQLFTFSYISNNCFDIDNIFYLEISDETGNFANSTILDFSYNLLEGEFNIFIPDHFEWSDDYKLRIRSTSPARYFVQNQIKFVFGLSEILTGNLHRLYFARNDTLFVPFDANCFEKDGQVFVVQLSDPFGTFINILEIGSQIGWGEDGKIFARIPLQASDGKRYRIRVVSKNPEVIGKDNGKDITIFGMITGVEDTENSDTKYSEIEVFPNPFNEKLFVNFPQKNIVKNTTITITNLLGIVRKQLTVRNSEQIEINTTDLENGVYFVTMEHQNQKLNLLMIKMKVNDF